jgi:hypothetical protein
MSRFVSSVLIVLQWLQVEVEHVMYPASEATRVLVGYPTKIIVPMLQAAGSPGEYQRRGIARIPEVERTVKIW